LGLIKGGVTRFRRLKPAVIDIAPRWGETQSNDCDFADCDSVRVVRKNSAKSFSDKHRQSKTAGQ
jgi:hypothetical protein